MQILTKSTNVYGLGYIGNDFHGAVHKDGNTIVNGFLTEDIFSFCHQFNIINGSSECRGYIHTTLKYTNNTAKPTRAQLFSAIQDAPEATLKALNDEIKKEGFKIQLTKLPAIVMDKKLEIFLDTLVSDDMYPSGRMLRCAEPEVSAQ